MTSLSMKALLIAASALGVLAAASCARPAPPPVDGCGIVETHTLSFSNADTSDAGAGDTVEARSFGPDCATAVVSLTIRAADGTPLWVYAAPAGRVFPETTAGAVDPASAAEAMRVLLRRWTRVAVATTAAEPAWTPIAAAPGTAPPDLGEAAPAGPWSTGFDPVTYADIRARSLPMACYETGPDGADCIYWEPAAGEALLFVQFAR